MGAGRKTAHTVASLYEVPQSLGGAAGYRREFEHIVGFSDGGQTCRCGGALACLRHNLCKAGTGWQYRRLPDGSFWWTDDTGHSYTGSPPQRWTP